jgi:hypothetical protein
MQDSTEVRWKMLCELAAHEQDPQKLLELVEEINNLIEKKQSRSTNSNSDESQLPGSEITK